MMGVWDAVASAGPYCKQSEPRSRQITTPTPHHSSFAGRKAGWSSWHPTDSVKALKAVKMLQEMLRNTFVFCWGPILSVLTVKCTSVQEVTKSVLHEIGVHISIWIWLLKEKGKRTAEMDHGWRRSIEVVLLILAKLAVLNFCSPSH